MIRALFGLRPDETAAFNAWRKTESAPSTQQLDQIAATPAEHENMPRVRLFSNPCATALAREAAPQIG